MHIGIDTNRFVPKSATSKLALRVRCWGHSNEQAECLFQVSIGFPDSPWLVTMNTHPEKPLAGQHQANS